MEADKYIQLWHLFHSIHEEVIFKQVIFKTLLQVLENWKYFCFSKE